MFSMGLPYHLIFKEHKDSF